MKNDSNRALPTVRDAQASEHATLARLLGRSFRDDPGIRWWVPDDRQWDRTAHRFFAAMLRSASSDAVILTTPELGGAALWTPPGDEESTLGETLRMLWVLVVMARSRAPIAVRSLSQTKGIRPKGDFWSLECIGTDPSQQGRGIGSALLRPMLERCDRDKLPAFLETANPSNHAFYQRHGFNIVGEYQLPKGGPPAWQMLREPDTG